ncbi:Asp23/Gls24 family envelope stress response protein [Dactylosporangium roseum]|uniref:Asp23/Gls24 family envelope stress response protein n=1 Tax=Dactylosporangium roseum TaxID=47989 RepID=A0ABY5ZBW0_9ACTN|nr:Asp23/Gls24 family envelope stress response protein [Dactylosporangium roseum]UWZ39608.1 Asp23/Gls24 family envelope stress response protein [Dactylosporangium roseum]
MTADPQPPAVEDAPGRADDTVPGSITIADRVVTKLASRAVLETPDAGAAAARLIGQVIPGAGHLGFRQTDLTGLPKASAQVDGNVAVIDLVISVRWPASVPQVTAAVRQHVRERLAALTGLTIAEARIVVTDLVTEIPSSRAG